MNFTPTEEQIAIGEAAKRTKDSLLISALAGAAKTTTLVGVVAPKLPVVPTMSVAFNKRIADELAKRLPSHIASKTLNSIGFSTWMRHTGKKFKIEGDKMYLLLKEETDALRGEDKKSAGEMFAGILRASRRAKSIGYIPREFHNVGKPLASVEQFLDSIGDDLDFEPDDLFLHLVDKVLMKSIALGHGSLMDFDDQLYLPTLFGASFPKFEIVMVDEAQDLSPLNHLMVEKMVGSRLIAVGDPNQSIYAFRGADINSMSLLQKRFSMKEFPLNVSFRCPRAVVERAQRRVPHMRYPDWAVEGKVEALSEWDERSVPDGAAIICRSNAPLFSCALALIRRGRSVKLLGADIGVALVKLLRKLGPGAMPREEVMTSIDAWERKEIAGARESRHAGIHDRAECMRVFAEYGDTLDGAVAWAEQLFSSVGNIFLMTGHKSKGLEFDTVFHLDSFRIPSKWAREAADRGDRTKLEQELNLEYVINTRSKLELFFVNLEDFG